MKYGYARTGTDASQNAARGFSSNPGLRQIFVTTASTDQHRSPAPSHPTSARAQTPGLSSAARARRLVVDTGLHAKRWTRQQGIDYGIEASEVERYAVYPGQACSYMMGELKIIECRERAKKALGAKFSLRQFHNKVLMTGTVPLELLDRQVDAWIKSQG